MDKVNSRANQIRHKNRKKRIAKTGKACYNIQCVRPKGAAPTLGCRQAVRHQTLTLAFVGSNPAIPASYDPLAQSVEQLPFKQWVWSSSLQRVTNKEKTTPTTAWFFFIHGGEGDSKIECKCPVDACLPPAGWRQHHKFLPMGRNCNESPAGSDASAAGGR